MTTLTIKVLTNILAHTNSVFDTIQIRLSCAPSTTTRVAPRGFRLHAGVFLNPPYKFQINVLSAQMLKITVLGAPLHYVAY